jgi:hypothetical protein
MDYLLAIAAWMTRTDAFSRCHAAASSEMAVHMPRKRQQSRVDVDRIGPRWLSEATGADSVAAIDNTRIAAGFPAPQTVQIFYVPNGAIDRPHRLLIGSSCMWCPADVG